MAASPLPPGAPTPPVELIGTQPQGAALRDLQNMETHLNAMETRLNAVETRLNEVETCLNAMKTRLNAMETRSTYAMPNGFNHLQARYVYLL